VRFEDERYVRVYTRDTTTTLLLSWEARALLWEILRKVDRAGLLDLGEEGVEALAANVRIPLDVVGRCLPELLRRSVLELRSNILVVPRFVEAQEAAASDPARARASRERARDLARAKAAGVTLRDDTPAEANGTVTLRDDTVTPGPSLVTPSVPSVPPTPSVPGEKHSHASAPPPSPSKSKPKREPRGTRLPDDWQPPPELLDKLRRELRVEPIACLKRFRNYWVNAIRNAVKPRWDLAFENWVERDAAEGKLPPWAPPVDRSNGAGASPKSADEGPPVPPPPGLLDRIAKLAEDKAATPVLPGDPDARWTPKPVAGGKS